MQGEPWNWVRIRWFMWRRWRSLSAVAAVLLAGAILPAILIPPSFSSTAWLYYEPAQRDLLDPQPRPVAGSDAARIESEINLISAQKTLALAARELQLANAMTGDNEAERDIAAVEWLRRHISAERRGNSYLIAISASSAASDEAARMANAVANAFIHTRIAGKVDDALADIATLRQRLAATAGALDEMREALADADSPDAGLRQRIAAARQQYEQLRDRLTQLEGEAYLQTSSTRLIQPAVVSLAPNSPNRLLLAGLGGVAALITAALLLLARGPASRDLTAEADPAGALGLRRLYGVPHQKQRRSEDGEWASSPADAILAAPLSPFSEAIRRLRVEMEHTRPEQPDGARGLVVMVSSTQGGEGKTTLALALARSLSQAGKSTLLIECDLRRPTLRQHLGLEASHGLLDHLRQPNDPAKLRAMLAEDDMTQLKVALGGNGSDEATDGLFAGEDFARVVAAAREGFDVVVLDTPPIGAVVDGIYIAPFADVVAFVLGYGKVQCQAARSAIATINRSRRSPAAVVGILNQQPGGLPVGWDASVLSHVPG